MLTFIALGGPATSIPTYYPWLTGGWPRQFFGRHNIWKGGRGKSTHAKGCTYILIRWNKPFNAKWDEILRANYHFLWLLARQGHLCVALSGSLCGSHWLILCDSLSEYLSAKVTDTSSFVLRDGSGYQNGLIFGKIPNGLRKIMLQTFYMDMVEYMQGGTRARYFEMHAHCTWFPEIGIILRGGGWGSRAV